MYFFFLTFVAYFTFRHKRISVLDFQKMRKKRVLIDLSMLKNINCGLGQISLNYAHYFMKNYKASEEEFQLYLLLPKKMFGMFGNEVKYVNSTSLINKYLPFFYPKVDLWHNTHQLSRFMPTSYKAKNILTIHDCNFMYEKTERKQKKYLRKIQKRIDRADVLTFISEFTENDVKKFTNVGNKEMIVIHNAVEQFDANLGKKPAFVGNNKPFFFTIGEIRRKKNFHTLLPLMKLFPEKELYIAGIDKGAYANEIRNTIIAENLTNVHLVGPISSNERIWMYANCQAFLFPSLFEGFGLPVIEAMSFGKPVFSSQETSLKEIGGNHAFFWNSFEPEEMKKVIDDNLDKYLSSPERIQANIDYAQSFSYKNHMAKYFSLYKRMLNE